MVSIIVPVYRSELTLERCVKSLLAQDYTDIEIILVVEAPPDGSGVLADKLAKLDERIRVVNEKNCGVSHARNTGLKFAKGNFIRFVDSDDYVQPEALSEMVARMEADGSDLVVCGYHHLYFGQTIVKLPHWDGLLSVRDDFSDMKRLYADGFLNMPWNKLFLRERITAGEDGGHTVGFDESLSLGEDLLFNLGYIAWADKISVLPICACEYVQDDRGTTLSSKKRDDKIEMALLLFQRAKDFFIGLYGDVELSFLKEKAITTFLDEIEGIGFARAGRKEKLSSLANYAAACRSFAREQGMTDARLPLLDYRIIYFFVKKDKPRLTYLMVLLRTAVVRLVRALRRKQQTGG